MRVRDAISINDLRILARRHLPRILFECIESGVEDEYGLARNLAAFREYQLVPRFLRDVSQRDQTTSVLGRTYAGPFGIAPTGVAALFRPGGEVMLAEAAAASNIPYVMSGSSFASIEKVAKIAPENTWYQLYQAKDANITQDVVRRVRDAGFPVLVVTVDQPVLPKLERDRRNGFSVPFKLTLPILLDALWHPAWTFEYLLNGGMPILETWAAYAPAGASAREVAVFRRTQVPSVQTWQALAKLRQLWSGPMVVKGLMHPDDVLQAAELGVDGVIVSNHGAKILDRAPATIAILAEIAAAAGDRLTVMLDSGVRRGSDIVIARCLGAKFVFAGRAMLYGVAAGGVAGVSKAITILQEELDMTLALIGCARCDDLNAAFLLKGEHSAGDPERL